MISVYLFHLCHLRSAFYPDLPECVSMMEEFIAAEPELWNEDIGE